MILIFSSQFELSTNKVIAWLEFYSQDFIRINSEDSNKISIDNIAYPKEIKVNGKKIVIEQVKALWLRKWEKTNLVYKKTMSREEILMASNIIEDEFVGVSAYILEIFKNKLGIIDDYYLHYYKLIQLKIAHEVGLLTPESALVTNYRDIKIKGNLITKPL